MNELEVFQKSLEISRITLIISIVLSVSSMVFAILGMAFQRSHNKRSVRPLCDIRLEDLEAVFKLGVYNSGLGPMIVTKVALEAAEARDALIRKRVRSFFFDACIHPILTDVLLRVYRCIARPLGEPKEISMRNSRLGAFAPLALCLGLSALALFPLSAQGATATPAAQAAVVAMVVTPASAADPYAGASAACKDVIAKASALMKDGSWKSAYDALSSFDANNADPYALALKIEICLKGYAATSMHQGFALVDLAPGQTLEALRSANGEGDTFSFDPSAAVDTQKAAGTAMPAMLAQALGEYYYDVERLFSGQWFLSDEDICTKSLGYYEAAASGGLSDVESLSRRGDLLMRFGRNDDAEKLLRSALALEPANAEIHTNLAICLAQNDKAADSYAEIDAALAAYKDPEHRFNSYLLGARLAAASDPARSEAYIAAAEKEFPEEPGPGLVRHMIAVQGGKGDAAAGAADQVLDRFSDSPYVVRGLLSTWVQANDLDAAMAFLDRNITRMQGKDASLGVLFFYKSLLLAQSKGAASFSEALDLLDSAEKSFKAVYKPDNQVFEAIAQFRTQLNQPAAPAATDDQGGEPAAAPSATPSADGQGASPSN